jgi:hypothetical protein
VRFPITVIALKVSKVSDVSTVNTFVEPWDLDE